MFCIAAINDVDTTRSLSEPLAPTKEAQESRLTQMYGEALSQLQSGQLERAQSLFQAILQDPISIKAQVEPATGSGAMLQLRYSTLKNLAETYSKQGSDHHSDALECYLQAASIDGKDVVLWNRLGTLACALGNLNVARRAFEEGLRCSPRHWSCMEKLVEILIAVGDEAACLAVTKQLLRLSPSHPRAMRIQHVIERGSDPCGSVSSKKIQESPLAETISPRGIDLLQPEYFSLSFQNKRKLESAYETEQFQKKRKLYTIDVNLSEASWFALVNAVADVLKGDRFWKDDETLLSAQIVVSPEGLEANEEKVPPSALPCGLVNASVKFSLHKSSPVAADPSAVPTENLPVKESEPGQEEGDKKLLSCSKTPEEIAGEGSGVTPVVSEPKVSGVQVTDAHVEGTKDMEIDAPAQPRHLGTGEKTETLKALEVGYDWDQPLQERRSTRLEKLRSCRRLDKEEDGFGSLGQSKDPARALKKTLEAFTVCAVGSGTSSMFGSVPESINRDDSQSMSTPRSTDGSYNRRHADGASAYLQAEAQRNSQGRDLINEEEEKGVLQFLKENLINSGIYHVAQQLLERVVANRPRQRKSLSWLLFLEKLTRMWAAERSVDCSLFLAEVYMDMASSATSEITALKCLNDCNYNLCCLLESATLQESDFDTSSSIKEGNRRLNVEATVEGMSKTSSTAEIGISVAISGVGSNETSDKRAEKVTPRSEKIPLESYAGKADDDLCATNRMVNKDPPGDMSVQDLQNNWSFWTRFHWLSGRLWVRSGQSEQAYREFERCQWILGSQERTCGSALVLLPHCKLDREISLERVQCKLYELQVEILLKHSATKMLEQGNYSDLIQLLTPVLLAGKGRLSDKPTWEGDELRKGEAAVASHELKGLDMLVTACEKSKPPNLVLSLQCRQLRLKLLCRAAGLVEVKVGESSTSSPGKSIFTLLDSEPDNSQLNPNGQWSKLVSDEVQQVSRCAARLREKLDDPGNLVVGVLPPVLGRVQVLLLTLMCHFVQALSAHKGHTGLANLSLSNQFHSCCFVDAAIAFCRLQHLHPEVPMEQQIGLLVTLHDVLAEYGLCCAGRECEGGEGAFLKMAIKHLGSLELKLKPQTSQKRPSKTSEAKLQASSTEPKIDKTAIIVESPDSHPSDFRKGVDIEISGELVENNAPANAQNQDEDKVDGDRKRVELGLDYALDQNFFCLYGLNLRGEATSNDGLIEHQNTNRGDYKTKEQCAGVLQYILPYANTCSRAGLMKLKKVLKAVYKQFQSPPADMLAERSVDIFLEDPDFDEDKLRDVMDSGVSGEQVVTFALRSGRNTQEPEGGGALDPTVGDGSTSSQASYVTASSVMSGMAKGPSGVGTQPGKHPYAKVYENLYYLVAQVEDMSASDKWPGFVLTKEGEEFVQTNSNFFKYDLCYNPLRFESWQRLAKVFDEEVDLLLNDGSKNINVGEWRKSDNFAPRVELSRRQSRRSLLMALALAATPEQKSEVNELLALVYYDSIQNVVPSYDQRRHIPVRNAAWIAACEKAFAHFGVAYSFKPHWTHVFYLGKLSEKLEHSHAEALAYYKKAVDMNPTTVDPLYRLHASRLKLLCRSRRNDSNVLQAVGQHCFQPSTLEKVHTICKCASITIPHVAILKVESAVMAADGSAGETSDVQKPDEMEKCNYPTVADLDEEASKELLKQVWSILFEDCAGALQSCFEGELRHFHKARYRMALGLHCRGTERDLEKAKEELAFCFKTHRSLFTINMWEIDESHLRKSRRKPVHQRVLELGMPESSRKFISCVRKYLIFYLTLCEEAEDLCTLERAYTCLKADRKFSLCLEDISRVALGKYILALARAICQAGAEGSTSQTKFHSLLEKMFNLYMDYGISWADSAGLSLAEAGIMNEPEVAESAIYSYIHRYIQILEADNRVDALEVVNERIRKRFKNPKLVGAQSAQVCKHASLAWCWALCAALCSITTPPQETAPATSWLTGQGVEDKRRDQEVHLIVDLQEDFTATNPYEVQALPTPRAHHVLQKEGVNSRAEPSTSVTPGAAPSRLLEFSKMKHLPVMQASLDNLEKATTLLRSSYVFYRDSFSGPFPNGINLFVTQPGRNSFRTDGLSNLGSPGGPPVGAEELDISTPRKLLLWAFALVHGRTGSVAEAVKYCEEQAKPRLKKGLSSLSQGTPPLPPTTVTPVTQERSVNTDKTSFSSGKQPISQSPAAGSTSDADRGWLPVEMDLNTAAVSIASPSFQASIEAFAGPSYAVTAGSGVTVANALSLPSPRNGHPNS